MFSALEGGQTGLDRGPHRVARPGVFIGPGPEAANAVLGEGRRQADRRHHGAGAGIGLLTRVDGPGLKAPAELLFDLAHAQQSRPPTGSRRPLSVVRCPARRTAAEHLRATPGGVLPP